MILVINTNRIIAALIKDSVSRMIINSPKLRFFSVNFGRREIEKYEQEILEKANITKEQFEDLLAIILGKISVISDLVIEEYMEEAKEIMDETDKADTPFIAAALAMNCGIWSDDEHFQKQNKIKVWKTKDLIKYI